MKSQRKEVKASKLDPTKVSNLHRRGFSVPEIAKQQGVAPSTVRRLMERLKPELEAVEAFKQNRADVLAKIQGKSLELQERIIDSLDEGVVAALTPGQKGHLLIALNSQAGTLFDKERLERGQSVHNLSVMSQMINGCIMNVYKPTNSQASQENAAASLDAVGEGETSR